MTTEAELKEAQTATTAAQKELADLKESGEKQATELARMQETAVLSEAVSVATEALGKVEQLPEAAQKRLVETLSKAPPLTDGKLDRDAFATAIEEAAKAEVAYFADVMQSGKIIGMGGGGPDSKAHQESLKESFTVILGGDEALAESAAKGR